MPERAEQIAVDPAALDPETLRRLVEEFVTRSGTDYGAREVGLAERVASVLRQLRRGEARIVFDAESGSADIVPAAGPGRRRAGAGAGRLAAGDPEL